MHAPKLPPNLACFWMQDPCLMQRPMTKFWDKDAGSSAASSLPLVRRPMTKYLQVFGLPIVVLHNVHFV
jgi:hypothetical protein